MIGAKPKTEPTDRSNSPAVMSSVIPSVIMPSSGVKANKLLILLVERKAGDRRVKTRISTASKTNAPTSGAEISLCNKAYNRIWIRLGPRGGPETVRYSLFVRAALHDLEVFVSFIFFVECSDADVESRRNATSCHGGNRERE